MNKRDPFVESVSCQGVAAVLPGESDLLPEYLSLCFHILIRHSKIDTVGTRRKTVRGRGYFVPFLVFFVSGVADGARGSWSIGVVSSCSYRVNRQFSTKT